MVALMVCQILCLLILTHTTSGLLSDYKICGDTECESRMSRVQAIQDHHSKDCRFLSFRQGDIIFVYHKLTGKREDLWAGTMDRKFGYFPKYAVKVEAIYATTENLLKTQKSDFFCIDENGYPIDTTELDDNANNLYLQETTQKISTSQHSTSQELYETSVNTKTTSGQEDSEEVETLHEQTGSPSWLKSSVTGLWELVQKDGTPIPKEDRREVMIGDPSLTSSVTGWLGFGAKENGENSQETKVQDTEASSTLGSSMTDWLGFGINTKVHEQNRENHGKRVEDDKTAEVFRGRKIALDLQENDQFHPEEKKETGTLDWIGEGISSTLGFGLNAKESTQEGAPDEMEKELKPASSSWFDIGITNMLGFKGEGVDERSDQMQNKDSLVADQDNDAISSTPSQKQLEVIDAGIDMKESHHLYYHDTSESLIDVQISANSGSDTEMKQEHGEDSLQTSEANTNENELSQMSYEMGTLKDQKETDEDEDTTWPANCEPNHGSQISYDQANQETLQIESNTTDANPDLQTENTPKEITQNCSELDSKVSETRNLQSDMGQEIQTEAREEIQEEMYSIIKVNDIQEVVNEKPDISVEIIDTKQDVVGKERPKAELEDEGIGETETIFQNADQIKENIEQQDAKEVEKEKKGNKLNAGKGEEQNYEEVSEVESSEEMVVLENNNQESFEDSHEDGKVELKEEWWQLDEVTETLEVEDNPAWLTIQEHNENNLYTANELNYIKVTDEKNNNFDEKENSQQLVIEDNDIKERVDNTSIEDIQAIASNNYEVSKTNEERTNHEETKPNSKDTEQNVYENFSSSLFDGSDIAKLYDQMVKGSNVKEENSEKLEVSMTSSNPNADLDIVENKLADTDSRTAVYKVEEEVQFSASQTVQNENAIELPHELTPSSDTNGEIQLKNREVPGLFNNAFGFFTYSDKLQTTSLNSETVTEESQVSIILNEDANVKNNPKDTADSQMFTPSVQFPYVQSASVTTVNPKKLHKLYHNILTLMNANELEIIIFHFGEHKMQFLDFILGSLDTATGEHDADTSILLDIERLLHYHMERLLVPSKRNNAPEEDKETSRTLIALQKLELVLEKVKEAFNIIKADDKEQEQVIWKSKDKEINYENIEEMHGRSDMETEDQGHKTRDPNLDFHEYISSDAQGQIHAALELISWLTVQVVSALPDDIRPGPDLYGVPWEPVIISGLVGLVTVLVFVCRCYSSVKSRMYGSKERWMAEQVAQLLDEKCKVLETLSKVQQEYNDVEDSLRDSGILAQTQKTIQLEAKAKQLERSKKESESDLELLKDQLNQQREHRLEQEQRITALEESITSCEEETNMFQSQEEQGQTTLKVYSMNSDRLQRNLETAGEENALLHENNIHLQQQLEGWAERVSELEEEMRRCEHSHSGMLQDVATKDERIMSLTDRLLQMKAWDSDLEGEQGTEGDREASNGTAESGATNGTGADTDPQGHLQKVQKLIHAAKLNADLKSVDEDKDRIFAKLNDEVKAKGDLQGSIKDLENEKLSLQSDTLHYTDQVQVLQQKLQIMTEMYQENELKLHRLLTVEEKERLQKEEKLTKADKNIAMAMEELNNYRQRAEEMEEELEKTKQSYQTQISSHERKAHNNWLAARSAERELAEIRRENALLRQKLTDTQFKLEAIEKDPYALDSLARPLPFRGRPASETRAFLSPPTLMDGPPNRLSPRVVMRGPLEPPVGSGDMERTGGPHSDSGSISPIWERDHRGPPPGPMPGGPLSGPLPGLPGTMAPPGYIFPEPGGLVYRRPPPGPMGLLPAPGPLPPRGSRPPGPPADMTDGPYRENSLGPGEHDHREPGGVERTPPETDLRMGSLPPPGPVMGPMDGPFLRRAPYGPPPPEYYLPRGPGGPPMPVWGPPPGMMYPPRFPPGGPPPPHMTPHSGPALRPPMSDGHPPPSIGPPQPPLSALTQRQSSEEHTPSPQDII